MAPIETLGSINAVLFKYGIILIQKQTRFQNNRISGFKNRSYLCNKTKQNKPVDKQETKRFLFFFYFFFTKRLYLTFPLYYPYNRFPKFGTILMGHPVYQYYQVLMIWLMIHRVIQYSSMNTNTSCNPLKQMALLIQRFYV